VFSELVIGLTRYEARSPLAVILPGALRTMNETRRFKLVLSLEAPDFGKARRELVETLDSVTAKGLLDPFDSPPTIRVARLRYKKWGFLDSD